MTHLPEGGRDMEAALARAAWRTSSYSGGSGNCVEVADGLPGAVGVRDSKVPGGRALVFTAAAWRAFAGQVKSGNPVNRTISKADLTR